MLTSRAGGASVVYAQESLEPRLPGMREVSSGTCLAGLAAWFQYVFADEDEREETKQERVRRMTEGKRTAMRLEATDFYSRYRGQSWKNVISVGDARYERDALLEMAEERRTSERGELRAKALTVPPKQSLQEMTFSLQLTRTLLPALVRYDGSLDEVMASERPLDALAEALDLPELAELASPSLEDPAQVEAYIAEVAELLQGAMANDALIFGA